MKNVSTRIGVGLSGGGFRATAFHLGTLNKLHEMGILERVSVLSTVSGGSITGSYYCLNAGDYDKFSADLKSKLMRVNIVRDIVVSPRFLLVNLIWIGLLVAAGMLSKLFFLAAMLISLVLIWRWQFRILPVSEIVATLYDRHFFLGKKLKDLADGPELAINATNMQTGRPFTFSKRKMDDSAYAFNLGKQVKFKHDHFPVAAAVAASTCVPVYFSPVRIPEEFYSDIADMSRCRPQLVDGGVYDNQGIHKLSHPGSTYECQVIIVSDAGNRFSYLTQCRNNFGLLARTSDVMMQRIKNIQMTKNIYEPTDATKNKNIAYLSLGWDLEGCIPGFIDALKKGLIPPGTLAAHGIPVHMTADIDQYRDEISNILTRNTKYEEILERSPPAELLMRARKVKAGLWPINELLLDTLIAHAENMTELQIKLYCPLLVTIVNSK